MATVSILLTGFITLFLTLTLIEDTGFKLSFLATLGILVVKPLIDDGLDHFGCIGKFTGDDIGTTIVAQVATLPILMPFAEIPSLLRLGVNACPEQILICEGKDVMIP